MSNSLGQFNLDGRVVVITGGAGLLGPRHAKAVCDAGGTAVLLDIRGPEAEQRALELSAQGASAIGLGADITERTSLEGAFTEILRRFGRIDGLINNAANDPKVGASQSPGWARVEEFPLDVWNRDLNVGVTGAFLCAQVFGSHFARQRRGSIVNISSDLGLIAPDQRLYRRPGLSEDQQPVKPVSYVVAKSALLGLTRYLATYWAESGVRVNTLCPGGVELEQSAEFKRDLTSRIPMGRMAQLHEYEGAIVFLLSDASSYMTGATLVIDGGRTIW